MATTLTFSGMKRGAKDILPVAIFVIPFGMAFGVAALETGLSGLFSLGMSAFVFAGASQFASLPLWGVAVPILPLIIITFAVNARHILMGATLYPWMMELSWPKKLGVLALLSDANFANSVAAWEKGETDVGYLLGGGVVLWVNWLAGTWAGLMFGQLVSNPKAYGLDVVMLAYFAALMVGAWKGKETLYPWLGAGLAAVAAYYLLPPNWHVIVGALTGGLIGALRHDHS
jgi:4-azaleucine resistance transporter AzlC